jgi:hypothetical protein
VKIVICAFFLFAYLTIVSASNTLEIHRRATNPTQKPEQCLECLDANGQGPCQLEGDRYQLLKQVDGAGAINTYYGDAVTSTKGVFTVKMVPTIIRDLFVFTLENRKLQQKGAAPNDKDQKVRYRFTFFNQDATKAVKVFYLNGYENCDITLNKVPMVAGKPVLNVVVGNVIQK